MRQIYFKNYYNFESYITVPHSNEACIFDPTRSSYSGQRAEVAEARSFPFLQSQMQTVFLASNPTAKR